MRRVRLLAAASERALVVMGLLVINSASAVAGAVALPAPRQSRCVVPLVFAAFAVLPTLQYRMT